MLINFYILVIITALFSSCKSYLNQNENEIRDEELAINEDSSFYENYFIVIADTGLNYFDLKDKMLRLQQSSGINIDTMNRYYNIGKDEIILKEDDIDEMYAGTYAPRRITSSSLSLEYLKFYRQLSSEKMIALVAGIFEDEQTADSLLLHIRKFEVNAFKLNSRIYVGCMH